MLCGSTTNSCVAGQWTVFPMAASLAVARFGDSILMLKSLRQRGQKRQTLNSLGLEECSSSVNSVRGRTRAAST